MTSSDNTDIKNESFKKEGCPFCSDDIKAGIIAENALMFAIHDSSPVTKHHILIIPKRHCHDYFELTREERCDSHQLAATLKKSLLEKDNSITGFNMGVNCGVASGQTVFHSHIHLIPRRDNDTPNPRGGVRGVIPDKMDY
jgi:diadenosine tetraphosphate (Ap4A) HIT family hydrolase